ncbi:CgeB family protein [Allohahella sp. A8]|uniref:CgeB family protein n=1 Tax=Allohahella sp. A8 TaxID=3141461 RepID=UPI003A7FF4EB
MKFSLFYHSLVSDWNHGNAHFLRGIVSELLALGHEVRVYEPQDSWSKINLLQDHGIRALKQFQEYYPGLDSISYSRDTLELAEIAAASDVVIVHEWNEPWLVNGLGELREAAQASRADNFCLLFHDTHHRAVSDESWLRRFRLDAYDGVLAFGEVLSDVYRRHGWHNHVWTWHEAADIRMFYPRKDDPNRPRGDVVWVGNWGDDERTAELETFLFGPVRDLGLSCQIHGVRYPQPVLTRLAKDGIDYRGWLPNFKAPEVFANHKVTVHVPRRYYASRLPGIPTIRPFEAMACGLPLICAPWQDSEGLFTPGSDYLVAEDGEQMRAHLRQVINDPGFANELSARALETIRTRHTCGHRVAQLLDILEDLDVASLDESATTTNTGSTSHAYS